MRHKASWSAAILTRGLVLSFLCSALPLAGQPDPETALLFESQDPLDMTLLLDVETVRHDIGDDHSYHAATFLFSSTDRATPALPLRIRTRADFRRRPENCDFPPLRLNFRKRDVVGTLFANQDKLKLVNHCRDFDPQFEQHVLLEYLIYKGLNVLTPESFRVRLIAMTYSDFSNNTPSITRPAFIIEDENQLAERSMSSVDERNPAPRKAFDPEALALFYLYQYLIGNIDWDYEYPRNLVNIRRKKGGDVIAVPFDFDLAQIVGQARGDDFPMIGSKALRHVLFHDLCLTREELASSIDRFLSKKDDLIAIFSSHQLLTDASISHAMWYVDRFYRVLEDEALIEREFIQPCRSDS